MIYRQSGKWQFCTHIVKYKDKGQEIERYALPSRKWWEDTINKHSHLELIEFIEVEPTEEQQERLEKLNQLRVSEGFTSYCQNYVETGEFPEILNNPLWQLKTDVSIEDMKPIELKTDKQQIETNGTDTATITGEIPTDFEKVHVMVNSPPPVYEEINDGEIEIEFTTEDEGFHVVEVTAGNHRGLVVIEGVSSSG